MSKKGTKSKSRRSKNTAVKLRRYARQVANRGWSGAVVEYERHRYDHYSCYISDAKVISSLNDLEDPQFAIYLTSPNVKVRELIQARIEFLKTIKEIEKTYKNRLDRIKERYGNGNTRKKDQCLDQC